MSKKFSKTAADYLEWETATNLVIRLAAGGNHTMSLLVAIGIFIGLRQEELLETYGILTF